jgi:hypothetical protein
LTENRELSSEYQWCLDEFAAAELGDARLNARCGELAVQLAKQPNGPSNRSGEDWADTKAAYRFFDNDQVTPDRIQAPHYERTVERMAQCKRVLAVQDTSFLNYTPHPKTQGLGEIGTKKKKQRGCGLHSTLAVTPGGLPLGLLTQAFFTRPIGEPSHTPAECRKLPIEEKESYRWLEAFEQIIALKPAGVQVVTVCDAEADIYEMFSLAQEKKAPLLVRASANRVLLEDEFHKLWPKLEHQSRAGSYSIQIVGNNKRKARTTTVSVRFGEVTFRPPWRPTGVTLPAVTLRATLVKEENPPADVDEPIEWLLLTNVPVPTFAAASEIIGWYCCRWQIELFHKVLKSGCRVEDCRLRTAERLFNFIALMSVIAWRLHWMTYINRCRADLPCTVALTTVEWEALYMRIHKTSQLPDFVPTIYQAVRWIAKLGGFLGRKSDGEPGLTTIWRGWLRLRDIADTWYLVKEHANATCG